MTAFPLRTDDDYTLERRLCDDTGTVSDQPVAPANIFDTALTYLQQLNNLRAATSLGHRLALRPVAEAFTCTGSAHLAGEHIKCLSPAHSYPRLRSVERIIDGVEGASSADKENAMNTNTGVLYPSLAAAAAAGERREDLVEIRGTQAQAERISAGIQELNRAARREQERHTRHRGRGFTK